MTKRKNKQQRNGHFPFYRGAYDYIATYSDSAWKLYTYFLGHSNWTANPRHDEFATYTFAIKNVAETLHHNRATIRRAIDELAVGHLPDAPAFIEIVRVDGNTRSMMITIRILKAKLTLQKQRGAKRKTRGGQYDRIAMPKPRDGASIETRRYFDEMKKRVMNK